MRVRRKSVLLLAPVLVLVVLLAAAACSGSQGDQGIQGEQGVQGVQGIQGEQGPQGEQGIQGEQGPQGDQGPKGDQGLEGDPGIEGSALSVLELREMVYEEIEEVLTEAPPLNVELGNPGHWHVSRSKTLSITVTDASAQPVEGLAPELTVKTLQGRVGKTVMQDAGAGVYTAAYTAWDLGSGYETGYSVSVALSYLGHSYYDAWPVEVVRDGNERILPEKDGNKFAYQIRYGLDTLRPTASDEQPVTVYFDPRRAIQEGANINTEQPFRNTFNSLVDLTPTVLVESVDGSISEEVTPTYTGMGVYRAQRLFTKAEVGTQREYKVSFVFTDPYNGVVIGKEHSSYPVTVTAPTSNLTARGARLLNLTLGNPGHWHLTRSKTLSVSIADAEGIPIGGLQPELTVKTLQGRTDKIAMQDAGNGTYIADYTASDLGGGYSTGYVLSVGVEYLGQQYHDAWPVEVVRDGNERILPEKDGNKFAYQIRYGLGNTQPVADDEQPVTIYFDPRRAIQEGADINTAQPWRNTFNPLPGLTPTVIVESVDGTITEEIAPTYTGMGVYRAQRVFTKAEVGDEREYKVSFVFTDPYNGVVIGKEHSSYPVTVTGAAQTSTSGPGGAIATTPGGLIFSNACGACHALPTAEKIRSYATDEAMLDVARSMAEAAHLGAEDVQKLLDYLVSIRHGS